MITSKGMKAYMLLIIFSWIIRKALWLFFILNSLWIKHRRKGTKVFKMKSVFQLFHKLININLSHLKSGSSMLIWILRLTPGLYQWKFIWFVKKWFVSVHSGWKWLILFFTCVFFDGGKICFLAFAGIVALRAINQD